MLGVTKPITLTVNVDRDPMAKGRTIGFLADGMIKRSDFGMTSGFPIINDALEIIVKTRALTDE